MSEINNNSQNLEETANKKLYSIISKTKIKKNKFNDIHIFARIVNSALIFEKNKNYFNANKLYHKACLMDDSNIPASGLVKASSGCIIDNYRHEIFRLKTHLENNPSEQNANRLKLIDLLENKEFNEASELLNSKFDIENQGLYAVDGDFNYADVGNIYFEMGDFDKALENYELAQNYHYKKNIELNFKKNKFIELKKKMYVDENYLSPHIKFKIHLIYALQGNSHYSIRYFDNLPQKFKIKNIEETVKMPEIINNLGYHSTANNMYKLLISKTFLCSWQGLYNKLGPTKCISYDEERMKTFNDDPYFK